MPAGLPPACIRIRVATHRKAGASGLRGNDNFPVMFHLAIIAIMSDQPLDDMFREEDQRPRDNQPSPGDDARERRAEKTRKRERKSQLQSG